MYIYILYIYIIYIYIRNRSGPYVEPWGTRTSISAKEEACLLSATLCFLFLKK